MITAAAVVIASFSRPFPWWVWAAVAADTIISLPGTIDFWMRLLSRGVTP